MDYGWDVVEGRNQDVESCVERAKCHRALYSSVGFGDLERREIKMDGDQDAHCKNMRKEDAIIQFIKNRWTSPYAIIIYFAFINPSSSL